MPTALRRAFTPLLFAGIVACGSADGEMRRVLVVGWDGATFRTLDPMLADGRLPNLASLIETGRTANLESTRIPISSAAWPTLTTGRGPGVHGVYSFFRTEPGSYDARLISARDVDAAPVWRILSGRGRGVNVWGVPVTYPPEPVRGTLVAGMLSPFEGDYAHPPGFADRLRSEGFLPDLGIWRRDELANMAEVERQLEIKEREVLALLERDDWTFSMVVFKSLDVLSHRPDLRQGGPQIGGVLERLDEILGAMVRAVGPETTVLVVSDHGFAEYRRRFDLHRWLVESGWSVNADAGLRGAERGGPLAEARARERSFRLGTLDMPRTRAFADAAEGNYCALRLNVRGREPSGVVERSAIDRTLSELERDLGSIEFPAGVPVVARTFRGAELYPGAHSDAHVPDLIVELRREWRGTTTALGEVLSVGGAPFPDHALEGVFVMSGGDVVPEATRGALELVDVAPLILYALDEPVPTSFEAASPAAAFLGFFRRGGAMRRIAHEEDPGMRSTGEVYRDARADADDASVESRVKSLGYGD